MSSGESLAVINHQKEISEMVDQVVSKLDHHEEGQTTEKKTATVNLRRPSVLWAELNASVAIKNLCSIAETRSKMVSNRNVCMRM
jgi:phage host-nuclease inhibitor protein Gam